MLTQLQLYICIYFLFIFIVIVNQADIGVVSGYKCFINYLKKFSYTITLVKSN